MKRRDEVTVGVLITVAVIVLVLGTLWLARGSLKSGYPLYTRFKWGQNLKQGQPVLLAGVSVGYVGDVNLRRDGFLDVTLRIDDNYQIPKGANATVKAVGIFGDVAIALTPPIPIPVASYTAGDTVPPGPPSADVTEIMNRVDSIGQSVSVLTRALQTEVVEAGTLRDLHKMIANTAAMSAQLQSVVAEQNRNLTALTTEQNRNLTQTMGSFRDAAQHFSAVADSAQLATSNLTRFVAHLDSTNARANALLAKAERGDGTVGKLLSDTLLYSDIRHLMQQTDSLMADFKKNPRKYINLSIF